MECEKKCEICVADVCAWRFSYMSVHIYKHTYKWASKCVCLMDKWVLVAVCVRACVGLLALVCCLPATCLYVVCVLVSCNE